MSGQKILDGLQDAINGNGTVRTVHVPERTDNPEGRFTWSDLIRHLTDWRRKDWRNDPERDAYRLENLEWVVHMVLEKLRDAEKQS